MELSEVIIKRIKDEGPISFRDYMEMALYYPELGYYTSSKDQIGTTGDFYTSSSLTPAFGAMIGRQMEQIWDLLDGGPFTIIEFGAGNGYLCHDILNYLQNNEKLYEQLRYCIIEKSATMRRKQQAHLKDKVSWHNSIRDISDINGCILSNELVDNFPVHKVLMDDELMEIYVDYHEEFIEILKPAPAALKDYLKELKIGLPKGFCTEINTDAVEWIKEIALSLKRGYVITIDYGYPSSALYHHCRSQGTLVCYYKHQVNDRLYENIGHQDITSHVNFSALKHWGDQYGLEYCGFTNQANFLLSLGFTEYLTETIESASDIAETAKKATFLRNTLLIDMGIKFKVLIQGKNISCSDLAGLKGSNKHVLEESV